MITTVIAGPCITPELMELYTQTVQSHKATCGADLIWVDHTPYPNTRSLRDEFNNRLRKLGYRSVFYNGPFFLERIWDVGINECHGNYYVVSNADVVFYPNWLTALLEDWKSLPHLFSMHPYMYTPNYKGDMYRDTLTPENRVIETDNPTPVCGLFKLPRQYEPNRDLIWGFTDLDFWLWLKSKGLKSGISYRSAVGHPWYSIISNMLPPDVDNPKRHQAEDKKLHQAKWKCE